MRFAVVLDDGLHSFPVDDFTNEVEARGCYQNCVDDGPENDGILSVELIRLNDDDDYLETLDYYEFNRTDKKIT